MKTPHSRLTRLSVLSTVFLALVAPHCGANPPEILWQTQAYPPGLVRQIAVSPDMQTLATVGANGVVKLWGILDGKPRTERQISGQSVGFSRDGQHLIVNGATRNTVDLLRAEDGEWVRTIEQKNEFSQHQQSRHIIETRSDRVDRLTLSADRDLLAVGSIYSLSWGGIPIVDLRIRVKRLSDGTVMQLGGIGEMNPHNATDYYTDHFLFSPDSRTLAARYRAVDEYDPPPSDGVDPPGVHQRFGLWSMPDGAALPAPPPPTGGDLFTPPPMPVPAEAMAFSPDGSLLAFGTSEKAVSLWPLPNGGTARTLTGHESVIRALAFSPDGQILATGDEGGTLILWRVGTGERLRTYTDGGGGIFSLAFSPEGYSLIYGRGDGKLVAAAHPYAPPPKAGDVNSDGSVNVIDAIFTLKIGIGAHPPTPPQRLAADVNRDEAVNVGDAVLILQYTVGIVPSLP